MAIKFNGVSLDEKNIERWFNAPETKALLDAIMTHITETEIDFLQALRVSKEPFNARDEQRRGGLQEACYIYGLIKDPESFKNTLKKLNKE